MHLRRVFFYLGLSLFAQPSFARGPVHGYAYPTVSKLEGKGLTAEQILISLGDSRDQFRHCYLQLMQRKPNWRDSISLKFKVDPEGKITSAESLTPNVPDAHLSKCILEKLKAHKFPASRSGSEAIVTSNFKFSPFPPNQDPYLPKEYEFLVSANFEANIEKIKGLGLDANDLLTTIDGRRSAFIYCFEKVQKREPAWSGSIPVEFKVNSEGKTAPSNVQAKDKFFQGCLSTSLSDLVFPKPKDGKEIAVKAQLKFARNSD